MEHCGAASPPTLLARLYLGVVICKLPKGAPPLAQNGCELCLGYCHCRVAAMPVDVPFLIHSCQLAAADLRGRVTLSMSLALSRARIAWHAAKPHLANRDGETWDAFLHPLCDKSSNVLPRRVVTALLCFRVAPAAHARGSARLASSDHTTRLLVAVLAECSTCLFNQILEVEARITALLRLYLHPARVGIRKLLCSRFAQ
eukprot:7383811-Prymnesium_polylepis.3